MTKTFPIDFVRQVIEQTLLEEHIKNNKYYGGKNQVNLISFYEQLQKDEQVNRYVNCYRDLVDQQNRTGLIMNGTIIAPENPTITNLYQCLIIPMSFTCSFRVKLGNRDSAINTINHLIETLKGRKCDIAEIENGELFKVGTIANENDGAPSTENGDYLGDWDTDFTLNSEIADIKTDLTNKGVDFKDANGNWYYLKNYANGKMIVAKKVDGTWEQVVDQEQNPNILFPPDGEFTKYKLSLSFDSLRCDEPRNLNADEYCTISFGGSATLVSNGVALGNDLVKVGIKKSLIKADTDITFNDTYQWLEPLELPSGNNADTQVNQLLSNNFVTNDHTDNITLSLQYTFVCDRQIDLINQFFKYARYGIQGTVAQSYSDGITPNIIYETQEIWSSWGNVETITFKTKVVESIDIENTESDTLSITIPFQIQGENN